MAHLRNPDADEGNSARTALEHDCGVTPPLRAFALEWSLIIDPDLGSPNTQVRPMICAQRLTT
jgi:hypothetical protein